MGAHSVITDWTSCHAQTFTPTIEIRDNTAIGTHFHLTAIDRGRFENGVLFGMNLTASDNGHGASGAGKLHISPVQRPPLSKGPVEIRDNVWVGSRATILTVVRIGAGAANAVLLKDLPEAAVFAGIPAFPVKDMTS